MSSNIEFLDFFLNKLEKTPTIKDVNQILDKMTEYSHVFQTGLELKNKKDMAKKVATARQKITSVKGKLDKVSKWGNYALATARIIAAIKVLKNTEDIRKDPLTHAKAFEDMFVAFSTFCDLHPMTKPYAPFFASFDGFFSKVSGGYSIGRRDTFHGRELMNIIDSIDRQAAPKGAI